MIDIKPALSIIEKENTHEGSLIPVLQKVQTLYGYLPKEVLKIISKRLNIPIAKVLGAATFFAQFGFEPRGKHVIKVCHGTACHIAEASKISDILTKNLGIEEGKTTKDMLFSLERVACLGCCSLSPVIMINDQTYGRLTHSKITRIINEYKKRTD